MLTRCATKFSLLLDQEWKQIFAILTAALVSLNSAILYSWPSPSIPILISDAFPGNVTMEQASYTTVIPSISSVVSSPLYPYLMDRIGRKPTLLSVAIPQLLSWILVARAESIYTIYIARFFSGFVSTCVYATLPVYIGEIASPNVRGLWGNAMSCCSYLGLFVMTTVGAYCSIQTSAYIFSGMTVVFFIIFCFMPESPYYCVMQGDVDGARENLQNLRKSDDVSKEFEEIRLGVERQINEPSRLVDLFRVRSNLKGLSICVAVRGAQQFAGVSAFAVYAPYLFEQAACQISATNSAIIYTAAMTVGSCTGSVFLDKIGRRASMMISCAGCATILLSEFAYFFYSSELLIRYNISLPYFPIIGMLIYVPLYSLGLGILPNLLLGELFPSGVKGKALCILNICFAIYSAICTKVFQLLYSAHGIYAPFLLFGLCCIVSTVFSYFCIPETRGKTLEQIQISLKSGSETDETNTRV